MRGLTIDSIARRHTYDKVYVRTLFDSIAHRYDFLNHFLSSGIDILWRRRAVEYIKPLQPKQILDVATGTADFAIAAIPLKPEKIIGIDISSKMLELGNIKIKNNHLEDIVSLEIGEAENLKYEPESFDVVMSAFGVRNFENLKLGLAEFHRVVRYGGAALILEFSKPKYSLIRFMYEAYSKYLVPILGGLFSHNRSAYTYLPNTIADFPSGNEFCSILHSVGFTEVRCYPQTFGIASIYLAMKTKAVG